MNNTNATDFRCIPPVFTWYTNPFNVTMFVMYLLVIVTALIGNVLVCLAVIINPVLRQNIASYFIVSLAVSDIATACFSMPFDLEMFMTFGRWYHSELMCRVWSKAYLITVPTSIWNLFVLSVDRYKTLKNPWDRFRESPFMTKNRALALISAVWAFGMACALAPEMGWKHREGGSLLVFCTGTICIFNVSKVYMMLSAAVNFYLPMIIMCFIYYKIYRIASTQFLTRPKSALLELKSDSPAATPKGKNKAEKPAQTDHKGKTRNDIEASRSCTSDHGHDNLAMDHDIDHNNRNKMMSRTSTIIEDIDLPGENSSHRHSYNLHEKGHASESVDRHGGAIEAVVNEANGKDGNDTQQRKMQSLTKKPDQQETRLQLEQLQPEQQNSSQREEHDLQVPQKQQQTKQTQELEEQQQLQLVQSHHHMLHHQNALVSNGKDDADGVEDVNDGDDNDDVSDDHNDDNDRIDVGRDGNNSGADNVASESNGHNNSDPVNDVESGEKATCSPSSDNDISSQITKPVPESVITVQSAENANDSTANVAVDGTTHANSTGVSFKSDNTEPLSPSHSETYNTHDAASLPIKKMSENGDSTMHTGVSQQMHQYLRRQVSNDDRVDRGRYGSQESICTLRSNVPDYGNSTLNLATSRETLNSFGSMEDITKRQKIFVKNKKAARTIATIVGTFLACWLPFTTWGIVWNICITQCNLTMEFRQINIYVRGVLLCLAYLSSALNPFIYSYRNVQFRNSYRKMIRKLFPCLKTVVRPH